MTISGNRITLAGSTTTAGGIYAVNINMLITNSTISGNTSAEKGGGIRNDTAITLTNSTVSNNTATRSAAALRLTTPFPARRPIFITPSSSPTLHLHNPTFIATALLKTLLPTATI